LYVSSCNPKAGVIGLISSSKLPGTRLGTLLHEVANASPLFIDIALSFIDIFL
jgi:hypothetical protein